MGTTALKSVYPEHQDPRPSAAVSTHGAFCPAPAPSGHSSLSDPCIRDFQPPAPHRMQEDSCRRNKWIERRCKYTENTQDNCESSALHPNLNETIVNMQGWAEYME